MHRQSPSGIRPTNFRITRCGWLIIIYTHMNLTKLGGARAERGRRGKQDECWRNPASENLFRDLAEILHPIGWDRQAVETWVLSLFLRSRLNRIAVAAATTSKQESLKGLIPRAGAGENKGEDKTSATKQQ
ncbi:predicted protein [Histoplasma mississippiense (nom. inval.)]|uniref:predicted protein n=1 Tax=Ajellomyces capsulatus (strain NAm1 / WU24) TaxID=2059318 RepID=UPI000157BC62|nr:predicted protein [Histoplasma mississippiense (nom. inval.)]EDN06219.1 predicted protein [Histoplasma mississippiense (nom. inval.)]